MAVDAYMQTYPANNEWLDELIATLRAVAPELPKRQGYTADAARVSWAFQEMLIDGIEMETLYEYLDSGLNLLAR